MIGLRVSARETESVRIMHNGVSRLEAMNEIYEKVDDPLYGRIIFHYGLGIGNIQVFRVSVEDWLQHNDVM